MLITDLTLIFTLVLFIIWMAPSVARWLRMPSVVILLTAGIILGEHGLGLLRYDQSFQLLGRIGMLYIMFLSAIEMDLEGFRRSRGKGLMFGMLTFAVPMVLGLLTSRYMLGMGWGSSMMMVTVYAAHTLLTYPIVSRGGLARHRVVSIAVGGTIVCVTLALLLLTAITSYYDGVNWILLLRYLVLIPLYLLMVFFVYPKITRRYLKSNPDPMLQVIFVLTLVFLSAYIADMVGLQGILGAFFAGLALNKFVPASSPLMNRVAFLGNALFIPFFLLGVGMLVDVSVFLHGGEALVLASVMLVVALAGKWLAAWLTARLAGMAHGERRLLFGLSGAKAAATLAVIMIGRQIIDSEGLPLLSQQVVSAAIVLILISCLISSLVTDRAVKQLAQEQKNNRRLNDDQQLLLALDNDSVRDIVMLGLIINRLSPQRPLLAITPEKGQEAKDVMNRAERTAAAVDEKLEWVKLRQTDMNIAAVMRRQGVSTYIVNARQCIHDNGLRWNDAIIDILNTTSRQTMICNMVQPVNTVRRILVAVPRYADREIGFRQWLATICHLASELGAKLIIYTNSILKARIRAFMEQNNIPLRVTYRELADWEDMLLIAKDRKENDMSIIIVSRPACVSYHPLMRLMPDMMKRFFNEQPTIVIFPEQNKEEQSEPAGLFDIA